MKKILKIGIIFLLCVQILNLNMVLAVNKNNSDQISIFLSLCFNRIRKSKRVIVSKKQKISVLDRAGYEQSQYISSGVILNRDAEFGELIKENDCIVAVPYEKDKISMWIHMTESDSFNDNIRACASCPGVPRESGRLRDIYLMKMECRRERHKHIRKGPVFDSPHIEVPKDKFPTIITEKSDSIPVDPLPVPWPII